jgi:lipoyl(octanoyl) transferase
MGNVIHLVPVSTRVPYAAGLQWQRELARAKIAGDLPQDFVLLLEHEPVVTMGRGATQANLVSPELMEAAGIAIVEVERGGDVTYHGPGQVVGYPILDLASYRKDLHWYLRQLEEALIVALDELGLPSFRSPGYTGVWVGSPSGDSDEAAAADRAAGRIRKISSIGVHVSRWVTWHGFALNRTREPLDGFRLIVPCGIPDVHMTSLEAEGIETADWDLYAALGTGFARAFGTRVFRGPAVDIGDTPRFDYASISLARPPGGGQDSDVKVPA